MGIEFSISISLFSSIRLFLVEILHQNHVYTSTIKNIDVDHNSNQQKCLIPFFAHFFFYRRAMLKYRNEYYNVIHENYTNEKDQKKIIWNEQFSQLSSLITSVCVKIHEMCS